MSESERVDEDEIIDVESYEETPGTSGIKRAAEVQEFISKRLRQIEKREQRERDFFKFVAEGDESSDDDEPLEGEELLREIELNKKMRAIVMEQVRGLKSNGAPFVRQFMEDHASMIQDYDKNDLEVLLTFMPNPYPL